MILYGIHSVEEALSSPVEVGEVWVGRGAKKARLEKIIRLARSRGVPVCLEPARQIERRAGTPHHQQVAARVGPIGTVPLEEIVATRPRLLLAVDGVEDPHNLGALLRTAEAAGVEGVILPRRRSASLTPAVVRSSAGAALHLSLAPVANLVRALQSLQQAGLWVVGLDVRGRHSLREIDATLPLVLVVGGEQRGLRPLVGRQCDWRVALPMKGKVGSLNLSVAAGVLLYQIVLGRE